MPGKKFWLIVFLIVVIIILIYMKEKQVITESGWERIEFNRSDRILVLAPHPDDEVLGCGGIIQKAVAMKLPLRIVFLTYGDNNQWSFWLYRKHPVVRPESVREMGLVRHDEAIAADKTLGVPPEQLIFLGYPDFRTLRIWYAHWGESPPGRSMLTDVKAVPYANAFRPGAPYKGEEILKDLKTIIQEFKPTRIFLSHPGDHNPDHRSFYLFSRIALWDLEKEIDPEVYPYLIHYKKWPLPKGYHPGSLLYPPGLFAKQIKWGINKLNTDEINVKHGAIEKHYSQYKSNAAYLLSFIRSPELFGDFPVITLQTNAPAVYLNSGREEEFEELPEELTEQENAYFVGLEEQAVRLENNDLVLSVKLSRPLAETVGISIYVFGYREDKSFQDMPKIHIRFGAFKHEVLNQDNLLPMEAVKILRQPKEIAVRVPLELLGEPERILTSADTYLGGVPLDWASWRVLDLRIKQ